MNLREEGAYSETYQIRNYNFEQPKKFSTTLHGSDYGVWLTDMIYFSWTLSILQFLMKHDVSEAGYTSVLRQERHLIWWAP
jgi:hypothetical protein